jgi:hypothetical protein
MAFKSSNLPLAIVRKILDHQGCKLIRHEKGHEKYSKKSLLRPIVIQDHIDPVPEFIVKQIMRTLGLSNKEMEKILSEI